MDTQTILEQQEETAARIQSAFENFKQVYSTRKPPPILKKSNKSWYQKISIKMIAQVIGIIGAIIVSASHTMPVLVGVDSVMDIEFGGTQFVIALASFAMVEIMAINFAYNATELNAGENTIEDVAGKTKAGERYLVFILALFNIYYVLTSNGVPIWNVVRIAIFLTIGTSAPVVAYLTGKILAVDSLKARSKSRRDNEEYEQAYQEWMDGLNKRWESQQKKWGGQVNIQVAKIEPQQLPQTVSNSSKQLEIGQTLNQKAAIQYIIANESEYKTHAKTVLEQNPTANKRIVAESIAMLMTGESRGYMTVIRAYKKLGKELL